MLRLASSKSVRVAKERFLIFTSTRLPILSISIETPYPEATNCVNESDAAYLKGFSNLGFSWNRRVEFQDYVKLQLFGIQATDFTS